MRNLFICIFLSVFLVGGCSSPIASPPVYRESQFMMGTIVSIDVCPGVEETEKGKSAYKTAWKRLKDIAWRMNVMDERSDVAKINNSTGDPIRIGADTYLVLKDSQAYSRKTKGAFDITVWPLIDLWERSEISNTFPTIEQIQKAQKAVGADNIQLLPNRTVRRINLQTKIDLGGIAKGYAIDETARIFRDHKIKDFFIDAGGDVYVGGKNCLGKLWRVGIRDPRSTTNIINIVEVSDAAVATSGNYEQYFVIEDERWSHIIDPTSGYPQKEVISSTVIAPTAMEADALATALSVLGSQSGTSYINTLTEKHASMIIVKNNSNNIQKFKSNTYFHFDAGSH